MNISLINNNFTLNNNIKHNSLLHFGSNNAIIFVTNSLFQNNNGSIIELYESNNHLFINNTIFNNNCFFDRIYCINIRHSFLTINNSFFEFNQS